MTFQHNVPPAVRLARIPGQVPPKQELKSLEKLTAMPKQQPVIDQTHRPTIHTINDVPDELGFSHTEHGYWVNFLSFLDDPYTTEIQIRQRLWTEIRAKVLDPAQGRALFQRAMSYVRTKPRMMTIVKPEELVKAARGGSYYKRVPKPGGGYRYFYSEEDYQKRDDAHISGKEGTDHAVTGKVSQMIERSNGKGVHVKELASLAKRYGSKTLTKTLHKQVKDGKLTLKGKRFSSKAKAKEPIKKARLYIPLYETLEKGGPFIGPKGGKWADAKHTIPWKAESAKPGKAAVLAAKTAPEFLDAIHAWHQASPKAAKAANPTAKWDRIPWEAWKKEVADPKHAEHKEALKDAADFMKQAHDHLSGKAKARAQKQAKADAKEAQYEAQGVEVDEPTKLSKLKGKKVWLYHGTTEKFLEAMKRTGLAPAKEHGEQSNVGSSGTVAATPDHVYLTGDGGSGPASAGFYAKQAAAKHGGDPVVIRVLVDGDDLQRDPDDTDLASGGYQFVTDRVSPEQIKEVDGERLNKSLEEQYLESLEKAGPFIGPKGGKWADTKHTVPWKDEKPSKFPKSGLPLLKQAELAHERGLSYLAYVGEQRKNLKTRYNTEGWTDAQWAGLMGDMKAAYDRAKPVRKAKAKASPVEKLEGKTTVTERGTTFETGKPVTFTFSRNLEAAPKLPRGAEDRYQQRIEPAGRYMTIVAKDTEPYGPNIIIDTVTFNKPLVIKGNTGDSGSAYDEHSWKMNLSRAFGGKKGKRLSAAIAAAGYDGIVTVNTSSRGDQYTSETVDLRFLHTGVMEKSLDSDWLEAQYLESLEKGAGHKYIRRIPTGNPKRPWQYIYSETAAKHAGKAQVGEKIRIKDGDQSGHYEVVSINENGWITIRHDETGKEVATRADNLQAMFLAEYKAGLDTKRAKLMETYRLAKLHGTPRIQARAERVLEAFQERFPDPASQSLEMTADDQIRIALRLKTSDAYLAAAQSALNAAGSDLPKARKARMGKMARNAMDAAKLEMARVRLSRDSKRGKKSKKAGKAGELAPREASRTHGEPAKTDPLPETSKFRVQTVKPIKKPSSLGAFGSKAYSWATVMESVGDAAADFHDANSRYMHWKGEVTRAGVSGRPKPKAWTGGELDKANEELQLKKPDRFSKKPDPRVTSPREAWDRLTANAKSWDDPQVATALQIMRTIPGYEDIRLPDRIQDWMVAKVEAESLDERKAAYEAEQREAAKEAEEERQAKEDAESGKYTEDDLSFDFGAEEGESLSPQEDYRENGTKAGAFKDWFGDWEEGEGSKVVKSDGSPAEQHPTKPIPVFHGTAVGGYRAFSKEFDKGQNIYGPGFYFTEDKAIADEYTKKDEDDIATQATGWRGPDGKEITHLTQEQVLKILESDGWIYTGPKGKPLEVPAEGTIHVEHPGPWEKHGNNWPESMWAAIDSQDDQGRVHLPTFLERYNDPSPRALQWNRAPEHKYSGQVKAGGSSKYRHPSKQIEKMLPKGSTPIVPEGELFEVFLNIRNPIDMDKAMSRDDFKHAARGFAHRSSTESVQRTAKSKLRVPYEGWKTNEEPGSKDYERSKEYYAEEMVRYNAAKAEKEAAIEALKDWPTLADMADPAKAEKVLRWQHNYGPTKLTVAQLEAGYMPSFYMDDVIGSDEAHTEVVGKSYDAPHSYDDFMAIKKHRRPMKAWVKDPDSGWGAPLLDKDGNRIESDEPAYGVHHIGPADQLTWGDFQHMMTNSQNRGDAKEFSDWAKSEGYDGIAHTGGWNVGTKAHRVWVAFEPNQIKKTENEGTFDPTTPDMHKSH